MEGKMVMRITGRSRQDGFHLVCRFFCLDDGPKKLLYPRRREEEKV